MKHVAWEYCSTFNICCPFHITLNNFSSVRITINYFFLSSSLSIPGIVMCQSVSIFFGSGLIFVTGVLYGMMALGKKSVPFLIKCLTCLNHDQLKIRPCFLPWVSKNRRYRILKGIDRLCDFLIIIEPRSLKFCRRI